jgi:hypothetical protein
MASLKQLIAFYDGKNKKVSHSRLASIILENEEIDIAHRTLRRKVGEYRLKPSLHEKSETITPESKVYQYKGEESISSLEEAISFFDIDLNLWDVAEYKCNSWDVTSKTGKRTNYQVSIKLKPKTIESDLTELKNLLSETLDITPYVKTVQKKGEGIGVAVLADFHIGAKVKGLKITPDFSYKHVVAKLRESAERINRHGYAQVHVNLLGDFIESFTGLNHINSWQGMEYNASGANGVIIAFEIIRDFLGSIDNLVEVNMVAGNHDRSTSNNKEDAKGEIATLLHYMLDSHFKDTPINYDPLILTRKIDGICHVLTHNHHGLSKKDCVKVFWDYGIQGMYNILLGGHWHSRKSTKFYQKVEEIHFDQADYRAISVPPIFTGNFYSESNGWSSTSGFIIIENNGHGKPNLFDYTLN